MKRRKFLELFSFAPFIALIPFIRSESAPVRSGTIYDFGGDESKIYFISNDAFWVIHAEPDRPVVWSQISSPLDWNATS